MSKSKNDRYITRVYNLVGKAINTYELISANDSVLIGLSGGKDSLALLESLAERLKYIPITYTLMAMHVNIENIDYSVNEDAMTQLCKKYDIPLYIKNTTVAMQDESKSHCFKCSWHRRKMLFNAMGEFKCNKLALGHNKDDVLETVILNMLFNGNISTIPPKLSMFDGEFEIVRPLYLLSEKELVGFSKIRNYSVVNKECPYADKSMRDKAKSLLKQMTDINPKSKNSIFSALSNIHNDYLPPKT